MTPTKDDLTLLRAIAACFDEGLCPSVRDVARVMGGVSTSMAGSRIDRLVHAGWLTHTQGRARTLRLTPHGAAALTGFTLVLYPPEPTP